MRRARPTDLDALARSSFGNALESEGLELDPAVVRPALERLLTEPSYGQAWVCEQAGQIVASTYVTREWSEWHGGWYWWIQSLFVVPEHRGKGAVDALMAAIAQAARDAGDVRRIRLYVERHNERALGAYARMGFTDTPYLVLERQV